MKRSHSPVALPFLLVVVLLLVPLAGAWVSASPVLAQGDPAWEIYPAPPAGALYAVDMVQASGRGWTGGVIGLLMNFTGDGWTQTWLDFEGAIVGLDMLDDSNGWAVTSSGQVLRYNGSSWQQVARPSDGFLSAIHMLNAGEGWAVGEGGKIFHYTGGNWQGVSSPTGTWLSAVDMVSPDNGWIAGGGVILHWDGSTWEDAHPSPEPRLGAGPGHDCG